MSVNAADGPDARTSVAALYAMAAGNASTPDPMLFDVKQAGAAYR